MGLITIKEYGERTGVSHAIMRQRCERGCFRTARKVGRDWMVEEDEPFVDQRMKANKIGRMKKIRVDSRYPVLWEDEFREYYPSLVACEECAGNIRPKWLDIQLEGWNLMDVPYEEWRPDLGKALGKVFCPGCLEANMDLFDQMYG